MATWKVSSCTKVLKLSAPGVRLSAASCEGEGCSVTIPCRLSTHLPISPDMALHNFLTVPLFEKVSTIAVSIYCFFSSSCFQYWVIRAPCWAAAFSVTLRLTQTWKHLELKTQLNRLGMDDQFYLWSQISFISHKGKASKNGYFTVNQQIKNLFWLDFFQNTYTNAEKLLAAAEELAQTGECNADDIYRWRSWNTPFQLHIPMNMNTYTYIHTYSKGRV